MQLQATTRVAPDFTEPDLAETCFWVTEEYASDVYLMVSTMLSAAIDADFYTD